jgi:NTE family protein
MTANVRTAIVLQGGGALGAYEYGVLQALYEARGKNFKPAIITGVSIGAVNAAVLAGAEDPLGTLDRLWREDFAVLEPTTSFSEQFKHMQLMPPIFQPYLSSLSSMLEVLPHMLQPVFQQLTPPVFQQYISSLGNESMYRLRPEYFYAPLVAAFFNTSIYDTSPLKDTLTRLIDLDKLNNESQVVVTALNVEKGELTRFGNTLSIQTGGEYANADSLSIEHILASSSLPPSFPMTEINGGSYWDGALHASLPLSEAINCLERVDDGSREVERELIVVELVPRAGQKPTNMPEVVSRFSNIIFASKLELDEALFDKYSQYIELIEQIDLLVSTIQADDDLSKKVDAALSARDANVTVERIRDHAGYQKLIEHRKIDSFRRIPFTAGHELRKASDFSKATIEARIEAGRQEALRQGIGEYRHTKP